MRLQLNIKGSYQPLIYNIFNLLLRGLHISGENRKGFVLKFYSRHWHLQIIRGEGRKGVSTVLLWTRTWVDFSRLCTSMSTTWKMKSPTQKTLLLTYLTPTCVNFNSSHFSFMGIDVDGSWDRKSLKHEILDSINRDSRI